MKKAEEYQQLGFDLNDWLKEKEKEADEALGVDDLTSEELQKKADKAKVRTVLGNQSFNLLRNGGEIEQLLGICNIRT